MVHAGATRTGRRRHSCDGARRAPTTSSCSRTCTGPTRRRSTSLRLLGARIERAPALVVATYRDDELDRAHPLRIVLGELATESGRSGGCTSPPLSPAAVAELAEPYGVDPDELYRMTGGQPVLRDRGARRPPGEIPADRARRRARARCAAAAPARGGPRGGRDRAAGAPSCGCSRRWPGTIDAARRVPGLRDARRAATASSLPARARAAGGRGVAAADRPTLRLHRRALAALAARRPRRLATWPGWPTTPRRRDDARRCSGSPRSRRRGILGRARTARRRRSTRGRCAMRTSCRSSEPRRAPRALLPRVLPHGPGRRGDRRTRAAVECYRAARRQPRRARRSLALEHPLVPWRSDEGRRTGHGSSGPARAASSRARAAPGLRQPCVPAPRGCRLGGRAPGARCARARGATRRHRDLDYVLMEPALLEAAGTTRRVERARRQPGPRHGRGDHQPLN